MKRTQKILIISISLLVCLVSGVTFAWWTISNNQSGNNSIDSGCLNVSYQNETGTLSLEKAYPMTDKDGQKLEGYSFTIINNCNAKVAYSVNLDVFNITNATNLSQENINVGIDRRVARSLATYKDTNIRATDAAYAKEIYTAVLSPNESYTHNIKMWVDVNVGNESQNAQFKSQVFVVAGQSVEAVEVTPEECFVTEGNTIIKYKSFLCDSKVIVPQYINGEEITNIANYAFSDANALVYMDYENDISIFVVMEEENMNYYRSLLQSSYDNWMIWTTDYQVVGASEFENWEYFESGLNSGMIGYLKLPNEYDLEEYGAFDWSQYDYTFRLGGLSENQKSLYNSSLEYVDLSRLANLSELSQDSLADCYNLRKVELPEGLVNIYGQAFSSASLLELYIPTTVKTIGGYAFYDNKLQSLEINSEITISLSAFSKNNLSKLEINNTVSLNNASFSDNPNLTAENIHIGYFSNNTINDFITTAAETSE